MNGNKSDTILFGTASRMRKFPSVSGINIAGNLVPLSDKIVTIGKTLDLSTSELLHSLHWLTVESRIVFKIAAITYTVLT